VLDSTYERKHVVIDFLSLDYFTNMMISSCIHFSANDIILFFFMIEQYSSVCVCVCVCVCV
jgi:hypothetical protein